MDWTTVCDKAIEYFEENEDEYIVTIEDLDSYTDYLDGHRYYEMSQLNERFDGCGATEIIDAVERYFDLDDDYFYEDSYGILYSTNEIDYSNWLDKYFIEALYDDGNRVDLPHYIEKLFDAYENGKDLDEDEEDEI